MKKKTVEVLTTEKLGAITREYNKKVVEDGTAPYTGWTGTNRKAGATDSEIKTAILAELKKNGIQATARQRGTYITALTFTVKVPKEFQVTETEYIEAEMKKRFNRRYFWMVPDGDTIRNDELYNLPMDEINAIKAYTFKREYQRAIENKDGETVKPEYIEAVKAIVNSFNADHSDTMTDYFDRAIYDNYKWKIA